MIALDRYRALFDTPGVQAAFIASVIGRLPIGIAGLAILLFVQGRSGSFAHAGLASALYVLGLGLVAPLVGRLIDRMGPRGVLAICSIVYPIALIALVGLVLRGAHPGWIAAAAFAAGAALPPVTICMRALFPRLLSDGGLLQTAYSLDSALIETVFILGPALVAFFVAAGYPAGAVLLAAICAAVGGPLFLRADAVRAWNAVNPGLRSSGWSLLSRGGLPAVYAATLFYSFAFGLYEVGVTAFATNRAMPALAGIALALASLGSAVGAVVYGSRHWQWPLSRQFVAALLAMSSSILLLAPVGNVYAFAVMNVVAGAPMATAIASQSLLVSRIAPREALAEAFTWGASCLLAGISGGIAAGGLLAEHVDPQWIIVAAALSTLVAAMIARLFVREPAGVSG